MRRLAGQRYAIRRHLPVIIGACLAFYFGYHTLFGARSYARLQFLERSVASISVEYDALHEQRTVLENRVRMLRPESLDRDLLEERVRHVLGYVRPQESVIIKSN